VTIYSCETCKSYEDDEGKSACNVREEWISEEVWKWIKVVGCASHSSVVQREYVLSELERDMHDHYDFMVAQYNMQGGPYYRGRKELYEQLFTKLAEIRKRSVSDLK
jgi:hypothetical protein